MYRFFLYIIIITTTISAFSRVFAEWCEIPDTLPTHTELTSKIDECLEGRRGKSDGPNSITDFVCPQAGMLKGSSEAISSGTLAYVIGVNIAFNKADREIKKYMQKLQKNREPDPTIWIENIRSCTDTIDGIYENICEFNTLTRIINEDKDKQYIITLGHYPQELCSPLAQKKAQWWYNLATIMMSDGIAKNKKNSTDKWVTEVKWAYWKILNNWHNYQKILARAAGKMTGYNEHVVWWG